jgi:murein DD-endopeptidase MepM/ murein hydrolase activator NlpD
MRVGAAASALALAFVFAAPGAAASDRRTEVPDTVTHGALVVGHAEPRSVVQLEGRRLRVAPDGSFAFGVGRDAASPLTLRVTWFDGAKETINLRVLPRDWPIERVVGVPAKTVNPPKHVAERIAREQALVSSARERDDPRTDFVQAFTWPVQGRISGRFGNQRVYVLPDGSDAPKSPHSGMDIAAPAGTPVRAPAAGVVTFAAPDLYLTGGTVLIDHGHGVSSNFLHLSRLDVAVGDRVEQGEAIGAVGATGRATGPHLHWGMSWFDVRVDPLLVLERAGVANGN